MNDPMTADDWLREIRRRAVPDRLYTEGAKIVVELRRENEQLREQLAAEAERQSAA